MDEKHDQERADDGSAPLRRRTASTRLTEQEHAAWTAAAGGRQLGRWIRAELSARMAGLPPTPPEGGAKRELVAELRRIGVNLNQIARRLNGHNPLDVAMVASHQSAEAALWAIHAAVIVAEVGTP